MGGTDSGSCINTFGDQHPHGGRGDVIFLKYFLYTALNFMKGVIKMREIKVKANGLKIEKQADTLRYADKNVNLSTLTAEIGKWFKERKFVIQMLQSDEDNKWLIQARKKGIWRACTASARELAVIVEGDPNDFKIDVAPSKWVNNLTSLTVISLLSLGVLLPFCGIATLWVVKIRKDLKEFIDLRLDFIEKANVKAA